MKLRFFDFEVYPHWWCCTFGDYPDDGNLDETIKDTFITVRSDEQNARDHLLHYLREEDYVLTGYNIKGYDLIIANAIYQGFTPEQVRCVNDIIIVPRDQFKSKEHMRLAPFAKKKIRLAAYNELMDDANGGSLKDCEAIMGLDIRETEVPFDKEDLTEEDIDSIIYYNKHDVYASMYYHKNIKYDYTQGKLALGRVFDIPEADCYKNTNANLCAKVLDAHYTTFADEHCSTVILPDSIKEYVYDSIPNKIVDQILTNPYTFDKDGNPKAQTLTFKLFGEDVTFGNGGLHSIYCNNLYVESNEEWALINADVGSFYPAIMLNFNCLSRAIKDKEKYRWIRDTRIALKHKENKTRDEKEQVSVFKLVLNTVFGASGNKYLPLYDKYMCLTTCRLGQIILASLGCQLHKHIPELKVIQTNTDGIMFYIRRKYLDVMHKVCDEFMKVMNMELEFDEEHRIWQRDVNNYLLTKESWDGILDWSKNLRYGDHIKLCGEWLQYTWKRPGYPNIGTLGGYAASKAAIEHLLLGSDIVTSIVRNNNVEDFCIFCKKGPTFRTVVQRFADGTEVELTRANRVVATTNEMYGKLYKIKYRNGVPSYNSFPNLPDNCKVINEDLSTVNLTELKKEIDFMHYINDAAELLEIEWVDVFGNKLNQFHFDD